MSGRYYRLSQAQRESALRHVSATPFTTTTTGTPRVHKFFPQTCELEFFYKIYEPTPRVP